MKYYIFEILLHRGGGAEKGKVAYFLSFQKGVLIREGEIRRQRGLNTKMKVC